VSEGASDPIDELGVDPIDAALETGRVPLLSRLTAPLRTRAALGLEPALAPVTLFVGLGLALGPVGLGALGEGGLARLEPAIAIATAALGVFAGLELLPHRGERRLFAAASLEALVTFAVVAAATGFLLLRWQLLSGLGVGLAALVLGLAAAPSSAAAAPGIGPRESRLADLDDALPIVVGAVVLPAVCRPATPPLEGFVLTAALGLAAAVCGWLLLEHARHSAERAVFLLGTIALLGGASASLGLSALLAGLVAGLSWRLAPGGADVVARRDLGPYQHVLVVLLLIVAGAGIGTEPAVLALGVAFAFFRLTGKVLGAYAAARVVAHPRPSTLATGLLSPGVMGVAFALAVHGARPDADVALLSGAAAVGIALSEPLSWLSPPTRSAAA
jgi:hypothetical protein